MKRNSPSLPGKEPPAKPGAASRRFLNLDQRHRPCGGARRFTDKLLHTVGTPRGRHHLQQFSGRGH